MMFANFRDIEHIDIPTYQSIKLISGRRAEIIMKNDQPVCQRPTTTGGAFRFPRQTSKRGQKRFTFRPTL
jgi:hypothetical protein